MPGRPWTDAEERQLLLALIDNTASLDRNQVSAIVEGKSAHACLYVAPT